MSGSVLAAGVPFLGPAVAAWIALIVAVMAFYFLSVSRQYRSRGVPGATGWRPPTSIEPQPRNDVTSTLWVSRSGPVHPETGLPSYDMEGYPDSKWGSPGGLTADPPAGGSTGHP